LISIQAGATMTHTGLRVRQVVRNGSDRHA
jgi:hypothetical protein